MTEGNINQEFRLKNIVEKRSYFIEEINKTEWKSKKHKKVCTFFSSIEQLLVLASTFAGRVYMSAFASLVGIPIETEISPAGLNICAIIAGVKKSNLSIIKKNN